MSKKRRVALISLHFAEYSVLLATALARDWEVLLVLRSDNAVNELGTDWRDLTEIAGIQVLSLDRSLSVRGVLQSAISIVCMVRKFNPDIIHCQEGYRDALMLALPFLPRVPRILTVHDPEPHTGRDADSLRLSRVGVYRKLLRRWFATVITHGDYLASRLAMVCPWLRNRIHIIPHGPLGGWREHISALPADGKLLFFGRIDEYKGLGVFVDAVRNLKAKGLSVTGVVAGMGPDLARHRAIMERAGCFEVYERYIPSGEVLDLFSSARVIVLPYFEGTQSGVAAMALGFGRPVVASAVGSISELVRDGENGLLVPPANPRALAECIEAVVCDNALAERLAAGARALRDGPLSWASIASATGNIYRSIIPAGTANDEACQ